MSYKDSKTIGNSLEETREYHKRYLRAVNSPIRRKILRALKSGPLTLEELGERVNMEQKTLSWHIDILEYGFCIDRIEKGGKEVLILTKEGEIVDYTDRS